MQLWLGLALENITLSKVDRRWMWANIGEILLCARHSLPSMAFSMTCCFYKSIITNYYNSIGKLLLSPHYHQRGNDYWKFMICLQKATWLVNVRKKLKSHLSCSCHIIILSQKIKYWKLHKLNMYHKNMGILFNHLTLNPMLSIWSQIWKNTEYL